MIIGEKNTDLKRLTGQLKLRFWQKLGDFIETKAKKSPTSPGLVSPVLVIIEEKSISNSYKITSYVTALLLQEQND